MKQEQTNKKLPEELSDLLEFIVRRRITSPQDFQMFSKNERFALYDVLGDRFLKGRERYYALDLYTAEGRNLLPDKAKELGDLFYESEDYAFALDHYKEAPDLVPKNRFIELAQHYLSFEDFNLETAKECYELAGEKIPSDILVDTANKFLRKGIVSTSKQLYEFAGRAMILDEKELIRIGDNLLAQNNIDGFYDVCKLAQIKLPIKKMLKQAEKCIHNFKENRRMNSLRAAHKLYSFAKDKAPAKKLIEMGELFFEHGYPIDALGAYKKAKKEVGAERLIEAGNQYLCSSGVKPFYPRDSLKLALASYHLAKERGTPEQIKIANEKLCQIGNEYLQQGYLAKADLIYKSLGKEIPQENLVHVGNRAIFEDNFEGAQVFYKRAGKEFPMEKVIEYGDRMLEYTPDKAERAYEFANKTVPADKTLQLAKAYLQRAQMESHPDPDKTKMNKAIYYFDQAGRKKTAEFLRKRYGDKK
nr:hypothetical protein [Nanoarchaeota archaeon]